MASKRQEEFERRYTSGNDQGKIGIVTGSNSGIGFEAARMLAHRGMHIILACRNTQKADLAAKKIVSSFPEASLSVEHLDLASLESVRQFSELILNKYSRLDLLVNNGGIMLGPYGLTEDGFEKILGTNHFGHFALNARLIDLILSTKNSRIVTVSSIAHFSGVINFDDLNAKKKYSRKVAYRQSKLANLLFAYELDRRLKEIDSTTLSVAVHPGITSTNIVKLPTLIDRLKEAVLMNTVKGALPTMMGACDKDLVGGEFIGPDGKGQIFGYPAVLRSGDHSYDKSTWTRLWKVSEDLTGIRFKI